MPSNPALAEFRVPSAHRRIVLDRDLESVCFEWLLHKRRMAWPADMTLEEAAKMMSTAAHDAFLDCWNKYKT